MGLGSAGFGVLGLGGRGLGSFWVGLFLGLVRAETLAPPLFPPSLGPLLDLGVHVHI